MNVGFTGTQDGTTSEQHATLCWLVRELEITEWHHGCCIGADAESVEVIQAWAPKARLVAHPPLNRGKISRLAIADSPIRRAPKPYLTRNRDIVLETDVLLACPKGPEELRSGTWATVRYARKQGKRIVIIYPDGTISEEAAK